MNNTLKRFLRGVGSVIDIAPAPDPRRYLPQRSDAELLRTDLEAIGADMCQIMETERHVRSTARSQR